MRAGFKRLERQMAVLAGDGTMRGSGTWNGVWIGSKISWSQTGGLTSDLNCCKNLLVLDAVER